MGRCTNCPPVKVPRAPLDTGHTIPCLDAGAVSSLVFLFPGLPWWCKPTQSWDWLETCPKDHVTSLLETLESLPFILRINSNPLTMAKKTGIFMMGPCMWLPLLPVQDYSLLLQDFWGHGSPGSLQTSFSTTPVSVQRAPSYSPPQPLTNADPLAADSHGPSSLLFILFATLSLCEIVTLICFHGCYLPTRAGTLFLAPRLGTWGCWVILVK